MAVLETRAYAKLNLTLDVLGRRPDGYHDLRMVMQSVALSDRVRLESDTGHPLSMSADLSFLPVNGQNLAVAAALRLCAAAGRSTDGLSIDLKKTIPVCAGMAGGSSDAAAVLRGLNQLLGLGFSQEELAKIGEQVGSDVPYCVLGGTALAEGRGELLTPLAPLPRCHIVVCKPPFPVSTPELFHRIDGVRVRRRPDTAGLLNALAAGDLTGVARRMYNVFEDVLPERRGAEIQAVKNTLIQHGALGAGMSGTGPTVFGLFDDPESARRAYAELRGSYRETFLTENVDQPGETQV